MQPNSRTGPSFLRTVASLWFGAVVLVLLLVAMACATVFESTHGTEKALIVFYRSWWFELLLALLAINVAAAMVVRFPFTKRQIGFVLTHTAILATLGGALVTEHFGVDGRVGFYEGETVTSLRVPHPTLTMANRVQRTRSTVDLDARAFTGLGAVDLASAPTLTLEEVQVDVARYLPDSELIEEVVNDNRFLRPAVEVSLSPQGRDDPVWLFADQKAALGPLTATYRAIKDGAELARLIADKPPEQKEGIVKVEYKGSNFQIPLSEAIDHAVSIGETGFTLRVLRYLPHATVGSDNKLTSLSDKPVNPAIEAEVVGPDGSEKRLAFARFPDFASMHPGTHTKDLKVTFIAAAGNALATPIEVLSGPQGALYVRMQRRGGDIVTSKVEVGDIVESPWPGLKIGVLRRFDRARLERKVEPVEPVRKERTPAVLVKITAPGDESELKDGAGEKKDGTAHNEREMWVQKYRPGPVTINGTPYEVTFADKQIPLGFSIKLDRFHLGYYPGGSRPRSFESHVTIVDPASGRTQSRVISMNHPTSYGGYTFYQSSYRMDGGRTASYLSVSRDPGQPIVFAGYIAMMVGMVMVLITRTSDRRRLGGPPRSGGVGVCTSVAQSAPPAPRSLSAQGAACGGGASGR